MRTLRPLSLLRWTLVLVDGSDELFHPRTVTNKKIVEDHIEYIESVKDIVLRAFWTCPDNRSRHCKSHVSSHGVL